MIESPRCASPSAGSPPSQLWTGWAVCSAHPHNRPPSLPNIWIYSRVLQLKLRTSQKQGWRCIPRARRAPFRYAPCGRFLENGPVLVSDNPLLAKLTYRLLVLTEYILRVQKAGMARVSSKPQEYVYALSSIGNSANKRRIICCRRNLWANS